MAESEKSPETHAKVVHTKDGKLRISSTKGKHRGMTVLLDPDDLVREQVGGFANFLRDYAVVGLAIGFIVGQQANAVAKSVVDTFVNPWVQILFGQKLSTRAATFHHNGDPVKLPWGAFVYTLMEFFFILIVIYVLIKLFRLDKFKKVDDKK